MNATVISRTIAKAERLTPEYKVVTHPQGGLTIARKDVGSGVWVYEGGGGSESELTKIIQSRRDAAMKAAFAGKLDARSRDSEDIQMVFDMEGGRPGFRKA